MDEDLSVRVEELERTVRVLDRELGRLRDIEDVRAAVLLYARSIDRCDPQTVIDIWHDDAVFEHFQTGIHVYSDAGERARLTSANRVSILSAKTLNISNISIDLDGDVAFVESYGTSYNTTEYEGETYQYVRTIRWCDRWERRDDRRWKLAYKLCLHDGFERWEQPAPSPFAATFHPEGRSGRGHDDPVFAMPERLRLDAARLGRPAAS